MKILFTTEKSQIRDVYFPEGVHQALSQLGEVIYNTTDDGLTPEQLAELVSDVDVCLTHWSCPTFSRDVLERANLLKLIVHAAGSVADLVTADVYGRGIKVCSANRLMAKCVAEGVLTDILAGLRWIPQQAYELKYQHIWRKRLVESRSLYGARVGLIGLGTIGRNLLPLLEPFHVQVKVFDPYLTADALRPFPGVEQASLEDVLRWGDVISIHASLTPETRGLLNTEKLKWIKDGALLVNTARGPIVDESALVEELKTGRISAVLDVFETEPLPDDSPLRSFENAILLPHVAGITAREEMSYAMVEEIRRFSHGEDLLYEIPFASFQLMTKEH